MANAAKQSKRVSWAPGAHLRKVRLFISDDPPCKSASGTQDLLEATNSCSQRLPGADCDDFLPPGFESSDSTNKVAFDISKIPLVKWKCAPNMFLRHEWHVAAGEESLETDAEKRRLFGILEAFYPHPSIIPQNPSVSAEVQQACYDDSRTLSVPIIVIEDEETADDLELTSEMMTHQPFSPSSYPTERQHGIPAASPTHPPDGMPFEPSVKTDAVAALASIMSNAHGSMIDKDLLMKLLSGVANPAQPISPASSTKSQASPMPHHVPTLSSTSQLVAPSATIPLPLAPRPATFPSAQSQVRDINHSTSANQPVPFIPNSQTAQFTSGPAALDTQQPFKDLNYYKNLIELHGGRKAGTQNSSVTQQGGFYRTNTNNMPREMKNRILRPCVYFNTPRGCRNGVNCLYQHDVLVRRQDDEQPNGSKRYKLDSGIAGRI